MLDINGNTDRAAKQHAPIPPHIGKRTTVAALLFTALTLVATGRLALLHLNPGEYLLLEDRFHQGELELREKRGEIFDRNGLLLACNRILPTLAVDPHRVADPDRLSDYLSCKLNLNRDDVYRAVTYKTDVRTGNPRRSNPILRRAKHLSGHDLEEILLMGEACATQEDPDVLAIIEAQLTGTATPDMLARKRKSPRPVVNCLHVQDEPLRVYPFGDAAAQVLGYVQYTGEPMAGIEAVFNQYLESQPGVLRARVDRDRRLLASETVTLEPPRGGDMLQLTLDMAIQRRLEQALDVAIEKHSAPNGVGVFMDPRTGAILAMATRPGFDPNRYNAYPDEHRKNRAIHDMFEPGSAFKIVTASAALEMRQVRLDEIIDCEGGTANFFGHRVRDYHKMELAPFTKCFEESSNIAMIKVASRIGPVYFDEWIQRFGFFRKTSRDFPGEARGLYKPLRDPDHPERPINVRQRWSKLTMTALPMGQEISVTTLQLVRAMAVIANGGFLVEPYVVERAVARDGLITYEHQSPEPVRILSPDTAETMKMLCHQAVLRGTGKRANIMEYRVGGKTGTAQIAGKGGYDPDRYTAVFVGFAPVAEPRIVGAVVIFQPKGWPRTGGYVSGPVFKEVAAEALASMGVEQDPVTDPDVIAEYQKQQALKTKTSGSKTDGRDASSVHLPAVPQVVAADDADTLSERPNTEDDEDTLPLEALIAPLDGISFVARRSAESGVENRMPNLVGLTKKQARERLQRINLPMDARGAGRVIAQDPPPGTDLTNVSICTLTFSNTGEWLPIRDLSPIEPETRTDTKEESKTRDG